MTEKDIKDFIAETEEDLRLAKQFLAMWNRRNGLSFPTTSEPPAVQPPLIAVGVPSEGDYGANKKAVIAVLEKFNGQFTVYDVEKGLNEAGTPLERAAISQSLNRLRKSGEIIQVKPGAGRNPAIYHVKSQN